MEETKEKSGLRIPNCYNISGNKELAVKAISERKSRNRQLKHKIIIGALILSALLGVLSTGCDIAVWNDGYYDYPDDWHYYGPPEPVNVFTITGDHKVTIYWDPIYYDDIEGYRIWKGYYESGRYYLIGETRSACFVDWDVANGVTYYYAISSIDFWGDESELSEDIIFDTPRPEGFNYRVYTREDYPDDSGFDFSTESVVPYNYRTADVYFGWDDRYEDYYMQAVDDNTDILIFGPTDDLSDVDWAPEEGWISGARVPIYEGYSYIVWTRSNNFAHIRIAYIIYDCIYFDWAYQLDEGNPELIIQGDESPFKYKGEERTTEHTVNIISDEFSYNADGNK